MCHLVCHLSVPWIQYTCVTWPVTCLSHGYTCVTWFVTCLSHGYTRVSLCLSPACPMDTLVCHLLCRLSVPWIHMCKWSVTGLSHGYTCVSPVLSHGYTPWPGLSPVCPMDTCVCHLVCHLSISWIHARVTWPVTCLSHGYTCVSPALSPVCPMDTHV